MNGVNTDRLVALLHAQQAEAAHRADVERGSPEFRAASARLDDLNDQIMRVGASGSMIHEAVGDGLELDLDSRPIEDAPFRRDVVDTVRDAVTIVAHTRVTQRPMDRRSVSERNRSRTPSLIREAQAALRKRYPNATISNETIASLMTAGATGPIDDDTIALRADRDGRVA